MPDVRTTDEPSMEDILASIRRILSEDEEPTPAVDPFLAHTTRTLTDFTLAQTRAPLYDDWRSCACGWTMNKLIALCGMAAGLGGFIVYVALRHG